MAAKTSPRNRRLSRQMLEHWTVAIASHSMATVILVTVARVLHVAC